MPDREPDATRRVPREERLDRIAREVEALRLEHIERVEKGPSMSALDRARTLYELRRARDPFFSGNADLFGEPAWDILLDLFVAREEGKQISISSSCIASCAAPTTALRWISLLEERGLVERQPDARDRRRAYVRLTAQAELALRTYLEAC